MKILNIISAALILSLSAVLSSAQTPEKLVRDVIAAASKECVTVEWALTADVDGSRLDEEGIVVAQDNLWLLKSEALDIYTSDDCTWILHTESKEAMIEPAWTYDDLEAFYGSVLAAGASVEVRTLSRTVSEKRPVSYFVPVLGDDWIVTDLR